MVMPIGRVEKLYQQRIAPLTREEQLLLLKLIAEGLVDELVTKPQGKHSLLEFEGAGVADPLGMDAQEYINQLRAEWDHRP